MTRSAGSVPIEYITARYYIKYSRLGDLMGLAFNNSPANHINLYIDLYGIYKQLLSRHAYTDMSDYTALTAGIVNMCGHYRSFFKKFGVYATIFLVSSYNIPSSILRYIPTYNKLFQEKLLAKSLREMLELNIELLSILCPYLPNIYFLKTEFESAVLIDHLIKQEMQRGNQDPNIIISTDLYPIQLVNYFPNTVYLRPMKSYGEDESIITVPKGVKTFDKVFWSVVTRSRSNNGSKANKIVLPASSFVSLEALSSFPERNLPVILNKTTAQKNIYYVTQGRDVPLTMELIYQYNSTLANRCPMDNVLPRFNALNEQYQYYLFQQSVEARMIHYEDLNDTDAIQMINAKYFASNPLDLGRL